MKLYKKKSNRYLSSQTLLQSIKLLASRTTYFHMVREHNVDQYCTNLIKKYFPLITLHSIMSAKKNNHTVLLCLLLLARNNNLYNIFILFSFIEFCRNYCGELFFFLTFSQSQWCFFFSFQYKNTIQNVIFKKMRQRVIYFFCNDRYLNSPYDSSMRAFYFLYFHLYISFELLI